VPTAHGGRLYRSARHLGWPNPWSSAASRPRSQARSSSPGVESPSGDLRRPAAVQPEVGPRRGNQGLRTRTSFASSPGCGPRRAARLSPPAKPACSDGLRE
jgi:hypothetical protein